MSDERGGGDTAMMIKERVVRIGPGFSTRVEVVKNRGYWMLEVGLEVWEKELYFARST